ncbi:MAG TPA: hypothetical protein V6C57_29645 [Coleofasciculaceae cyanobacterium]
MQFSTLAQVKSAVFAQIATTSTEAVKQWATQHGLDVDLRTKAGWMQVAEAIARHAQPVVEQAIATTKAVATAIHEADFEQINEAVCNEASALKVAAVDGVIEAYGILDQSWGPTLRFLWRSLKAVAIALAWAFTQVKLFAEALDCHYQAQIDSRVRGLDVAEPEPLEVFISEYVWVLALPVRDRLQVWALNRAAEVKRLARIRRTREMVLQFAGAVAIASVLA